MEITVGQDDICSLYVHYENYCRNPLGTVKKFVRRAMLKAEVETVEACLHLAGLYMRKRSNSSCWMGACSVEL